MITKIGVFKNRNFYSNILNEEYVLQMLMQIATFTFASKFKKNNFKNFPLDQEPQP